MHWSSRDDHLKIVKGYVVFINDFVLFGHMKLGVKCTKSHAWGPRGARNMNTFWIFLFFSYDNLFECVITHSRIATYVGTALGREVRGERVRGARVRGGIFIYLYIYIGDLSYERFPRGSWGSVPWVLYIGANINPFNICISIDVY